MSRLRQYSPCGLCQSTVNVRTFELCLFVDDAWEYIEFPCCGRCRRAFRYMLPVVPHVA